MLLFGQNCILHKRQINRPSFIFKSAAVDITTRILGAGREPSCGKPNAKLLSIRKDTFKSDLRQPKKATKISNCHISATSKYIHKYCFVFFSFLDVVACVGSHAPFRTCPNWKRLLDERCIASACPFNSNMIRRQLFPYAITDFCHIAHTCGIYVHTNAAVA